VDSIQQILIGKPLATDEAEHQTLSKKVGLAVFASDALSSVAYATQEILIVLIIAGTAALALSVPIAIAIVALLLVLTVSYRQTIFAYPGGGGAYIVARDNLGEYPALIAGAALLTDYVLTVAVSISAGIEQVASAIPALQPWRMEVAVAAVILMTVINLRGVKESGRVFAVPTYFFVFMIFITLAVGAFKSITGQLNPVTDVEVVHHTAENLALLLVLRAFSSGCTALTGVEAISNGIQAFKEPKSRNAAATLTVMSLILGVMFIGITLLARQVQAMPSETETVISQIGRAIYGRDIIYYLLIAATMVILIMAANTAFADFPRLAALQAGDGFLPRQLKFRSSRLVYGWGITALAVAAIALIVIFNARTTALIPLYAIGVFLSFTLSQVGMVVRWRRISKLKPGETRIVHHSLLEHDARWSIKLVINAVGAVLSFVVMLVFAYTKFPYGAWITVILIPALTFLFFRIHAHYRNVARILSLGKTRVKPTPHPMKTIVLVDDVHRGTVRVVDFAKSLGREWTPVHVDYNDRKTEVVQQKWRERVGEGELTIIPSPYRRLVEPIRDYVKAELDKNPDMFVHIIMGQLVMDTPWAKALHSNNSLGIMEDLQAMDRVIVTDVPYQLHAEDVVMYPENEPTEENIHLAHALDGKQVERKNDKPDKEGESMDAAL
jgi:amino acid transporter